MLKAMTRSMLEKAGYWTVNKNVLPFGVDHLWDINRLALQYNIPIKTAFDIGARGGETALEFLDAFPAAQIHSFEPHPDSFTCLDRIKDPRLHTNRIAASNRNGPAKFFVYSELAAPGSKVEVPASANNSLVQNTQLGLIAGTYEQSIEVQCTTVDKFCEDNKINHIDLLKIDTEGHELEVLDGATHTLKHTNFVFVEFETILNVPGATGGALAPVAERLEGLGFRFLASYPIHMIERPLYAAFNALFLTIRHVD